ncbi:hypothetical protein QO010_002947 [Caulobacter ginsengisoli]|uniref:Uncharacterized protein n=1 Tax=Caulobacter ginsengisoli TaxID=400775 RepID=A0ABU0IVK9_9CAUL|nr:hypothetical protein [Caulobacter ginsengisoli]MDQ0465163.1 hypothetical protein [Caulobacter ginsengisoli]
MQRQNWRSWWKWILPVVLGLNGAVMMLAPAAWYPAVPGVIQTGPFNGHFIRDIGAANLACAGGLGWWALDRKQVGAVFVAAVFLDLHAMIHLITPFAPGCGGRPVQDLARDFAGVFLPAIIASLIVWRGLKRKEA